MTVRMASLRVSHLLWILSVLGYTQPLRREHGDERTGRKSLERERG
jgi:hypothetical protein